MVHVSITEFCISIADKCHLWAASGADSHMNDFMNKISVINNFSPWGSTYPYDGKPEGSLDTEGLSEGLLLGSELG